MEKNLFGAFQRPTTSYRSLTAADLISLPGQQRRHISSVTGPTNSYQQQPVQQYKCRPSSDILQTQPTMKKNTSSPEAEAIDQWFENIQRYEQMLEQVAAASLDQGFKDELQHVNQWFRCRSDAERTAALYTVVQNASQIQIRFLITVLEQIANGGESYPAGQENSNTTAAATNNNTVQHQIHMPFNSNHSIISSSESASDFDKRRLPPSARRHPFVPSSAMSEPDDLRRRNRDLFVSRPLGLSHPGPLYEKALAARAQLQALNGTATSSSSSTTTTSTCSTTSSCSNSGSNNNANGGTGGLFSSPPRLRTSCSTTDLTSKSLFSSTDWPFPIDSAKSRNANDDSWSFGSLVAKKKLTSAPGSTVGSKKKDDMLPWAIQEEEQEYSKLSATITSSLSALEQAQARLRQDLSLPSHKKVIMPITQWTPPSPPSPPSQLPKPPTARASCIVSPPSLLPASVVSPISSQAGLLHASQSQFGQFLTPPTFSTPGEDSHTDEDQSDDNSNKDDKPLTGLARRRKRSSAARALKDKLAAEAQVIRMSDQDMIDAGVNTIGARRKLLKVFENVARHCTENNIDY
ncbi:hypothetical protein MAM1_0154d06751 [Mucor ambiguus]|uniref:RNA-binding protein vts1-like alpha-helical domain-containing protein n=1 Tax=Mucor ambiguus TaxID=91626 RepID=A0A0C9M9Y1_9FUNG|nr:hypothetical protein MAM1_0154d06751 [Mucor ambiguus]